MTMIKIYYYGMPVLMFAQTVLMLYGVVTLKNIGKKCKKRSDRIE